MSWHNYGLAVDIVFRDEAGWTWNEKLPWQDLRKIGGMLGLEYLSWDLPHFQKTWGLKIEEALKIFEEGKVIPSVWTELDKRRKI